MDLQQGYVVPPFGEAHTHNIEGLWNVEAAIARYLQDGVFYVKNPNSICELTERIRARLNHPASIDVVFANAGVTASGGHPEPLYEQVLRRARISRCLPLPSPPCRRFHGHAWDRRGLTEDRSVAMVGNNR